MAHGLAAAQRQRIVHDGLERQLLAAAHLVVGGDHGHGAHVHDPLLDRLGREAAEHHAVRGADARAGLHGHHALDGHGHVDQDAITLLHALRLERVGELRDALQQFAVADLGDLAAIGLEDDGRLVLDVRAHVLVQAIGAGIEFAVGEPAEERRVAVVQHLGEGLGPDHVLARQAGPEALVVVLCLGAQRLVLLHAGDAGLGGEVCRRREDPVLHQYRFNGGCCCGAHACLSPGLAK